MNLRDIKLRIRSVRKTQQITRAMKMVAAVKFRHAQARLLNARPYAARIGDLTARTLGQCDPTSEPDPLMRQHDGRRLLLVVVASDKGLCGSFNGNVYRMVQRYLKEQGAGPAEKRPEVGLLLIGRKINDLFKRFHPSNLTCSMHRYIPQAEADYAAIGKELIALFTGDQYDRIDVFYTEFKSIFQNRVVHEPLLPMAPMPAEPGGAQAFNMLLEPSLSEILADLLPRFLFTRIHQILMDSEASEQGTRMNMMDQATKNADDLINQLMLDFNKARQWSITRELSDITTGAEAMS
ncbi:MAG: ATP synthase F1 subunit gamma [Verrucomicrobia bacterium]|nr:ATP synthase F1 subunit gamma [Verrucomicrobiota bacterium]MCG2680971.1 ATP synthase F1 subunit gamma [Kiritimatiellia bacterium]MBU4248142.1 ATP synthase F1 subunit gamma [Verrucomicrobiota bacterium]MBU4290279.1 ATP synthase F1 subunit gamma [Verrucomicrobiota bacterium]MBU4428708.1 ATP synthase F1 subunit gamma [Verrucomicrobiota bacterium]